MVDQAFTVGPSWKTHERGWVPEPRGFRCKDAAWDCQLWNISERSCCGSNHCVSFFLMVQFMSLRWCYLCIPWIPCIPVFWWTIPLIAGFLSWRTHWILDKPADSFASEVNWSRTTRRSFENRNWLGQQLNITVLILKLSCMAHSYSNWD